MWDGLCKLVRDITIASKKASLALIRAITVPAKYSGFDSFPITKTIGKAPKLKPKRKSNPPNIQIGIGCAYITKPIEAAEINVL